jgi:radical SAM superfamily enzyme YgiQ (UPF0313 family)
MKVLLVQLPVPPPGVEPIEGNVPLAGAFLKLYAERQGLGKFFEIELLPPTLANTLGDQRLLGEILDRKPWMVGFTCYVWNIERTLWIAGQLKQGRPELKILLGGPEITPDNDWVLQRPEFDFAIAGEGEARFSKLLANLASGNVEPPSKVIAADATSDRGVMLDDVSSPYVKGILDLSDGGRLMLETVRGCRFHCKYCYYPKSCHEPRRLSNEQIIANLRHAVEHGAREVVLLDPTLNQRPDFTDFLGLLARNNPQGQLAFSGELRAEGIDVETARLLREANFREVEIGLQSVEPRAWELMGRPTNLAGFQRGVKAMLEEGIKVQVDLILGLPGDTVDSVRRGFDFLQQTQAYSEVQVFNLSILPGTAFRREAEALGLKHQPWPPYYALKTPTLDVDRMVRLMEEAQEAFGIEFDPMPPPNLNLFDEPGDPRRGCRIDLDVIEGEYFSNTERNDFHSALCFTLWLRSADFHQRRYTLKAMIERLLTDNPHTTLLVVLEPTAEPERLTVETLELLMAACYRTTTYLDRYYSLHPGRLLGAKRLFVLLPPEMRDRVDEAWLERISEDAAVIEK